MTWPTLPRHRELEQARGHLMSGRPLVVHGPIGVGKTTILSQAIDRLEGPRRSVIWAHATESTATIPLSPFASLLPPTPSADPIAMLRSVLGAIEERSGTDGVIVAVDLLLTQSWACVAMTVRTGEGLSAAVRAVTHHPRVERIEVGPLDRATTSEVLRAALGPTSSDLDEELWRVTAGNPLLLRELVEHPSGRFEPDDDGVWVRVGPLFTAQLTDLVRERMSSVDADQRAALEVVAVAAPAPYVILETALGSDVLTELEHAGLVSVAGTGDDATVRPAHPIHGEILAAHTGDRRRRDAYGRIARAAVEFDHLVDPLRIAVWQLRSGSVIDAVRAVEGALVALGRHDPGLAEALLTPVVTERPSPGVAIPMGRSMALQGRPADAEEVLAAAVTGDDAELAELASARAFNLAFGLGRIDQAIELLHRSGELLPAGSLRSRLDAECGAIAGLKGDFQMAVRSSEAALASSASDLTRTSAFVSSTLANAMLGRCDGFDRLVVDGVSSASTTRDRLPFARTQMLVMHAHVMMISGRFDAAVQLARTELGPMAVDEPSRTPWLSTLALALAQQGHVPDAMDAVLAAHRSTHPSDTFSLSAQALALGRWIEGLTGDISPAVESGGSQDVRVAVWAGRADAWAAAAVGDIAAAAGCAAEAGAAAVAAQHVSWGSMVLHDAVRFGHPELVVDDLEWAVGVTSGASFVVAVADHARALAERSAERLTSLVQTFARQGLPLLAAEVAAQAAAVLEANGRSIEAARAAAASMAWEMSCPGSVSPALRTRPPLLGQREWQIAVDAATGSTSRDIAARHFISVRTVDNHLGSVYRKLGVEGRDELGRFVVARVSDG